MTATLQAIYPITDGANFDYDYFAKTHLALVRQHFGPHGLSSVTATKGLAGGPGAPPAYFAVTTMTFPDEASMQAALGAAGPVLADVPNYTNCRPDLLIGSLIT